ncbi:hypothetical protein FZ029_24770 [Azospirillum sp. Sh1]|nr:hypothetical protein FZ029_24770 [Azospirillum sp. Sh1]
MASSSRCLRCRSRPIRCREGDFPTRFSLSPRGEGRGEGDALRAFHKGPATHPPHPNPLPGGERGLKEGRGRITAVQTWKLSPQPQRPFSLGFLKTKPVWNLSST